MCEAQAKGSGRGESNSTSGLSQMVGCQSRNGDRETGPPGERFQQWLNTTQFCGCTLIYYNVVYTWRAPGGLLESWSQPSSFWPGGQGSLSNAHNAVIFLTRFPQRAATFSATALARLPQCFTALWTMCVDIVGCGAWLCRQSFLWAKTNQLV